MTYGPFVRIALRYGIGYLIGAELGEQLAMDDDLVTALGLASAAIVEGVYVAAKKKGWAT